MCLLACAGTQPGCIGSSNLHVFRLFGEKVSSESASLPVSWAWQSAPHAVQESQALVLDNKETARDGLLMFTQPSTVCLSGGYHQDRDVISGLAAADVAASAAGGAAAGGASSGSQATAEGRPLDSMTEDERFAAAIAASMGDSSAQGASSAAVDKARSSEPSDLEIPCPRIWTQIDRAQSKTKGMIAIRTVPAPASEKSSSGDLSPDVRIRLYRMPAWREVQAGSANSGVSISDLQLCESIEAPRALLGEAVYDKVMPLS